MKRSLAILTLAIPAWFLALEPALDRVLTTTVIIKETIR